MPAQLFWEWPAIHNSFQDPNDCAKRRSGNFLQRVSWLVWLKAYFRSTFVSNSASKKDLPLYPFPDSGLLCVKRFAKICWQLRDCGRRST